MRRPCLAGLAALLLALGPAIGAPAVEPVVLGFGPPADAAGPPPGWEALTFPRAPRHTRYTVVRDDAGWVLRAESERAASGLYRPVDLDPREHRTLSWRWKVESVPARPDPRHREGDDYAARVYVAFRYDPGNAGLWQRARYGAQRLIHGRYPPGLALVYVWENRLPVGTVFDSPYSDRVKIVVTRSGTADVGRWVSETRDVYEDYRRIVGAEPSRIEGVALMTDTDDTGGRVIAYYDAIRLGPEPSGR